MIDEFDELIDTIDDGNIENTDLQEVSDQLDRIFLSCCQNYPGSVAVRQSYVAYQKMSMSDLRDLPEQIIETDWGILESYDNPSDSIEFDPDEKEFRGAAEIFGEGSDNAKPEDFHPLLPPTFVSRRSNDILPNRSSSSIPHIPDPSGTQRRLVRLAFSLP
jgi:hypothetical protein